MNILGWIFIFLLVFIVGFVIGFAFAATSLLSLMRRKGFTDDEIARLKL